MEVDATLIVHFVSVLLFWQFMQWALVGPVQQVLEQRAERTRGALEKARALDAETAKVDAEIETALAGARAAGSAQADAVRRAAETDERALTDRYRTESLELLERERAATTKQVETVRAPLCAETERLAAAVVEKLLGRPA